MTVHRYRTKPADVEAMQFVLGTTTKQEIVDFCPDASVGAVITAEDPLGMASTDIRWIYVAPGIQGDPDDVTDGDFIVKNAAGQFVVCRTELFVESFDGPFPDIGAQDGNTMRARWGFV